MQDRYAGDIGDFGKLGLLRQIERSGLSVGVNWYLAPDEHHNSDGRYTEYARYRDCDEALWLALDCVAHGERSVAALERAGLMSARFYSERLELRNLSKPERRRCRERWHEGARNALRGCDVVFADPDNGLIVPSAAGGPRSGKYALPAELADYYGDGASVIYYQHQARRPDAFYVEQHLRLLDSVFPGAAGLGLKFCTTSRRYYFFAMQPTHADRLRSCVWQMLQTPWKRHFSLVLE